MTKKEKPIEGEVLPKRERGRPPREFKPEYCDKIIEVGRDGGGVAKMCLECNIGSYSTFYKWLDEYPEFAEAYAEAKTISLAFHEDILLAGALGRIKGYNFNSVAMIMNNKFPDFYKRGTGQGANTEINIGSINSIDNLSGDDLDKRIAALQRKLKMLPDEGSDDE